MARSKTAEVQAEAEALQTAPPAPRKKRGKPVALEVHKVETVWTEEKVIGEKSKATPKRREPEYEPEEEVEDEGDDYEGLPDGLADFLRSQGESSSDVLMEVRYIKDASGARAGIRDGMYCGTFNFDFNTYLDDLALMECTQPGKPARFVLRLKQDGRYLPNGTLHAEVLGASFDKKLAAGTITALPSPVAHHPAQQQPQVIVQQPAIDEDAIIDREFTRLERLKKLLGTNERREPEYAQPQNSDPKLELARYVMETPELAKQAIGNLIGGEAATAKAGVTEMIVSGAIDLAQSLMPTVGPALANFFNARAQAEQMRAYQLQQQLNGLPAAPSLPEQVAPQQVPKPVRQAPMEPLPIQAPVEIPPEDELFDRILAVCAQKPLLKPDVAAQNLLEYTDQFTLESGFNKFRMGYDKFLTNDVKDVIAFAAMVNPIAKRMSEEPDTEGWLTALQAELRKGLNDDDGNQDQQS